MKLACLLYLCSLGGGLAARILTVFPVPSHSHHQVYEPILRELTRRGHQVVSITTNPISNPGKNLKQIDVSFAQHLWHNENKVSNVIRDHKDNPLKLNYLLTYIMNDIINKELESPQVQALIKNETESFDLLLVEFTMFAMMGFKHRFRIPAIGITPLDSTYDGHMAVGNPFNPTLYPEYFLPFKDQNLNFIDRLTSFIFLVTTDMFTRIIVFPLDQATIGTYFGKDYPHVEDLMNSIDFLLINTNFIFHNIRPLTPATASISSGIHLKQAAELPKDIKTFLDESKEGVIYFSLGSNVKSSDIPEKTKDIILKVFSELPYKILWKLEMDTLKYKPENVKIMKWVPQQDLLRHKNIKLFISQCGLQSLEEALFNNVPVIGIPFFGDQEANAMKLEHKGLGVTLNHETINYEEFKSTILEVINNPKYKERSKELLALVKDEPMTGLEKSIFWIEYVIRHGGAQHLKGPGANLPIYQYYCLDLCALLVLIALMIFYAIYKMYKYLTFTYKFVVGCKKDKTD